jgi:hypothetical protein
MARVRTDPFIISFISICNVLFFCFVLLVKGKDHGLGEQLLNLLQALTGTEGETTFVRDMGFNFPLLTALDGVRSKLYAIPPPPPCAINCSPRNVWNVRGGAWCYGMQGRHALRLGGGHHPVPVRHRLGERRSRGRFVGRATCRLCRV